MIYTVGLSVQIEVTEDEPGEGYLPVLVIGATSGARDTLHRVAVPGVYESLQDAFAAAAKQVADKLMK